MTKEVLTPSIGDLVEAKAEIATYYGVIQEVLGNEIWAVFDTNMGGVEYNTPFLSVSNGGTSTFLTLDHHDDAYGAKCRVLVPIEML